MNRMRLTLTAAAALLLAILTGCVAQREAGPGHPNLIIVREFAFSPGAVTLDPSFGFSLNRGAPGVPLRQRADTVGRAAAFNLADTVAQQLVNLGYDAVRSDTASLEPDGRALVVTGAFRRIFEGHRRQNASIAVAVEIDSQAAGGGTRRLTAFNLDSRRLPQDPSGRHGSDVNFAATQIGATIARYVDDLARLNSWPKIAR
ncbi:MAG TPA: hypothetical protein VKQ73_11125 [Stellaceae bacterium]|nr:hypothetical protein [Stellaceae bacterium]